MPKIEKQFLAREMQGLLGNVISLQGESVTDLREISEKLGILVSKIEEDLFYFGNPEQKEKMKYEFRFIK